jgi:hypothetical protein
MNENSKCAFELASAARPGSKTRSVKPIFADIRADILPIFVRLSIRNKYRQISAKQPLPILANIGRVVLPIYICRYLPYQPTNRDKEISV